MTSLASYQSLLYSKKGSSYSRVSSPTRAQLYCQICNITLHAFPWQQTVMLQKENYDFTTGAATRSWAAQEEVNIPERLSDAQMKELKRALIKLLLEVCAHVLYPDKDVLLTKWPFTHWIRASCNLGLMHCI